jgi:allophanate hydrolase subunit 2
VTGGYPVLAVVGTDDLAAAAQLRPGDRMRFRAARCQSGDRTGSTAGPDGPWTTWARAP